MLFSMSFHVWSHAYCKHWKKSLSITVTKYTLLFSTNKHSGLQLSLPWLTSSNFPHFYAASSTPPAFMKMGNPDEKNCQNPKLVKWVGLKLKKQCLKFGTIQRHVLKPLFHLIIPFPTRTLHYSTLLSPYNSSRAWSRKEKEAGSGGNASTSGYGWCRGKCLQSKTGSKTPHALSTDKIILHLTPVWNSK